MSDIFLKTYDSSTITPLWQKVGSSGFVQSFNPISGNCLISCINGYSACPNDTEFLQIFDGLLQTGVPIESFIVLSGNNFFFEFPNGGVQFQNGFTVANSLDAINIITGTKDFITTILYRIL